MKQSNKSSFNLQSNFLRTGIFIMDSFHRIIGAGLDNEDDFALNSDQKQQLRTLQLQTKLRNERYIRNHPELQCLLTIFLEEVFIKKPENLREFAADFFTRPNLRRKVQLLLAESYPPPSEAEDESRPESIEVEDWIRPYESYPWDQEGSVEEFYAQGTATSPSSASTSSTLASLVTISS